MSLISKGGRVINEANLDFVRSLPCEACGEGPPSDPHHIRSKGSGGGDELENLSPLCRKCHSLCGLLGTKKFVYAYMVPWDVSGIYPRRADNGPG